MWTGTTGEHVVEKTDEAAVPCHKIKVAPFPRALVNE
jgi:hypothetical protein